MRCNMDTRNIVYQSFFRFINLPKKQDASDF